MQKRIFLTVISFLLILSLANAQSFEVGVVSIKDKIIVDEAAEFDILIQNNLNTTEEFTIKKAGYPFWDMYTKPIQNPITVTVPPSQSVATRIYVEALDKKNKGVDTYTFDTGVVSTRTGFEIKAPITIGIKSIAPLIGGYLPTVTTSINIPPSIDPRQQFTIKVLLNNQNILDYDDLTIRAESGLFQEEVHTSLGPKEEKTIEITRKIDDATAPQKDRLVVSVLQDNRIIVNPIVREFEIREYSIQKEIETQKSFLKTRKRIEITSNNPNFEGRARVEIDPAKSLFITSSPKAQKIKEDGKTYFVWNLDFNGDKEVVVYVTENYRPLVVIILLAIAAAVLYFLFRSPVVVSKSIAGVGTSEGGISDAKIVIKVKNRSPGAIESIEVIDHLPHIAHVEKELSIGSMQPHAVLKHPKRGLILKWNVESLEPGDERVLSYRMKSRLAILGEFSLPSATARTKIGNKVVISNSNRVSVGAGH